MKIGILTWYKSLNHGAVLQAYATQKYLEKNGYKSELIKYHRDVNDQRSPVFLFLQRAKKLLNGELKDRKYIKEMDIEKKSKFNNFCETELNCSNNYLEGDYDCTIVGSDMVFSLIQGFNPYMFGIGLNTKKIISYAASAGGTKIELADKMGVKKQIYSALSKFSSIGYRDKETLDFVKSFNLNNNCVENIDPVLLYGFENEKNNWDSNRWGVHKPYILIYAYHGFMNDKSEVKEIKKYANDNGLQVISCGYYHAWCDKNVNADPKEFLEMFKNASCVVTDTFHGTIFSIINKKKFVSIIRDNGFKVRYLLESCGLNDRIAGSSLEIYDLLNRKVSYEKCDEWLGVQRKKSGEYLLQNLK